MTKTLTALIRSALCGTSPDIASVDIKALYSLAKRHDLAHIVACSKPTPATDDPVTERELTRQMHLAVYRRTLLDRDLKQVCSLFDSEGIDYIPLKGAVIKTLYPESWMRTSCDNDILIRETDRERAKTLLADKLGYVVVHDKEKDISFKTQTQMNTELHFSLCDVDNRAYCRLSRVWEYATRREGSEHTLTNEFFMLYHIAHMATHMHDGGCGIRPFIDLYLLETKMQYDSGGLYEMLDECRLREFYQAASSLCRVWLEDEEHSETTEMLEEYVVSGGSYGTRSNMASAQQPQSGGRVKYILSRIFMPKDKLKKIYPQIEARPYLIPFYQVKRWCKLLKRDTRKMAKSEISGSRSKNDIFTILNL